MNGYNALLQVVGTPIGNLQDVSPRVMEALREAEVVACEDTRRCGQLYKLLAIKTPKLVSFYKEVEHRRVEALVVQLLEGTRMVLVSDAGMPGISDPGAVLVAAARAAGVRVEVIPGPCAATVAVAGSGFEGGFVMAGFLPRKGKERRARLEQLGACGETVVLYESPFRAKDTVADLLKAWGNRPAWLARELTKLHEEWVGPDLQGLADKLAGRGLKGECVLVIGKQ